MLSLGIEASLAFCTASASDGLPSMSPPPSLAATVIARASLVKSLPRRASTIAFLCLIPAHLECPAMASGFYPRTGGTSVRQGAGARRRPQVVERDGVLVGVHARPEALVAERVQLAVGGQALERLALEHRVLAQVVERARLEGEEAAVDPVLGARLLLEARTTRPSPSSQRDAERQLRPHHRHRREPAVRAVARAQRARGRRRPRRRRRWPGTAPAPSSSRTRHSRPPVGVSSAGVDAAHVDALAASRPRATNASTCSPR